MAHDAYLKRLTILLKHIHPRLTSTHKLVFKHVFGAIGGYVNGRIFVSCGKFGVALRLPPQTLESLFNEKIVKHLKYFPNGHVKKEYAVLQKRIIEDSHKFKKLLDKSIEYALSLKNT